MYEFTKDCMIGIPEIDKEHAHFFELANQAIYLTNDTGKIDSKITAYIEDLRNYAKTHFAHEEAYMESIHDPELPMQKKEHAAFLQKINSIDLSQDISIETVNDILNFSVRWLYHHIICNDMMIGHSILPEKKSDGFSNKIAFTDEYLTGISLIDEEHKELFAIIEKAHDIICNDFIADKYDSVMDVLHELKEYTQKHFSDEENYMRQIQYDQLPFQLAAHEGFIEKLIQLDLEDFENIEENPQEYLVGIIDFLLDWLVNHILKMDKRIGSYTL